MDQHMAAALAHPAKEADEQARLTPQQLDLIYQQKWFKLFVPPEQNGLGLGLPEGLRMEETLARIDGSLGWTITLCSGATQFTGYLPPALTGEIFKNDRVCFGGSGALSGIARETKEGYEVSGSWKYATGAPYCTHFTANCKIEKEGRLVTNAQGAPVYRSFLFTRDEVLIHNDWDTMGLRATASESFSVSAIQVPMERSFTILPAAATLPGVIYRYPFLQFAETTLAVNTLGMALHFLEAFQQLVQQKPGKGISGDASVWAMQQKGQQAAQLLQKLRERFYASADESWNCIQKSGIIPEALLQQVSRNSRLLARFSGKLVAGLYPLCGVAATRRGTVLNRIFRDIFTASQHALLNTPA
ncbi:Acyl-CoA dehydrogenase [Niabella drilacis]|uniref:Acyl-CoA dehydrogenase n=2 Tax=Niabella drilacis (strain DSM 25811 / CCM 8410 / CCUG 62505 / LMG 26954 / E90) TaxID=1285928 RepID=A0A1G6XMM7_NIADE|nr:Acyl-CoA dehydrogenase [Niabella drilacis]